MTSSSNSAHVMHIFFFKYDLQAYKAARSRNLPRGIIIWSSFEFRSTARNLRLLYEPFSSSYLIISSIWSLSSADTRTPTNTNPQKTSPFTIGNARGDGADIPKTCAVNAPWRSLENFGESETSSGDRLLGALAAGHKEKKTQTKQTLLPPPLGGAHWPLYCASPREFPTMPFKNTTVNCRFATHSQLRTGSVVA